jgi:hypothetical protein
MEKKTFKIKNYGWIDSKMGSVDLCVFEDDGATVYGASISLNLDDESDNGHWVFMETGIMGTCKHCVARNAASMVEMLAGNVLSKVTVFDEDGNDLEELDLNDIEHSHEEDFLSQFMESEEKNRTLH